VENKLSRLLLEVRKGNFAAIQLYQHLGFEQIGVRKGYYPVPKASEPAGREDAIVMQKYLEKVK
jgi:ribosomal-protein-alanine N-acetyltransferase